MFDIMVKKFINYKSLQWLRPQKPEQAMVFIIRNESHKTGGLVQFFSSPNIQLKKLSLSVERTIYERIENHGRTRTPLLQWSRSKCFQWGVQKSKDLPCDKLPRKNLEKIIWKDIRQIRRIFMGYQGTPNFWQTLCAVWSCSVPMECSKWEVIGYAGYGHSENLWIGRWILRLCNRLI